MKGPVDWLVAAVTVALTLLGLFAGWMLLQALRIAVEGGPL